MVENATWKKMLDVSAVLTLVINGTTIIISILAAIGIAIASIAGILYLIALCFNIGLIFFNFTILNREDTRGKKLKVLSYAFLLLFFFAFFLMFYYQIICVIEQDVTSTRYLVAKLMNNVGYYGILTFGLALTIVDLKLRQHPETWLK